MAQSSLSEIKEMMSGSDLTRLDGFSVARHLQRSTPTNLKLISHTHEIKLYIWSPPRGGLRTCQLSPESQELLTALQSTELSFKVLDVFEPVPDIEATHNQLSLLSPSLSPLSIPPDTPPERTPSPGSPRYRTPSPGSVNPNPSPRVNPDTRPTPGSIQQINPIPNITQLPQMSTLHPLPAQNECSAPKWDSKYEEQLPTFFEEFETIAKAAGIDTDDTDMKKGILCYADPESMRF
ncbi:hypothetical protein BT96DRAFT_985385 [Gymnopus androsaceus JB14]|uniref:Uncharacterized protein n=1 Tax=Gymnopus androsaceus JB14 TaxID=1447944 RepID=A0A6A4IJ86_9AGAR|nr:hypothetical protein BT96DRAFT_985385 [Gymnopus androsaceus JB14]